MKRLIENHHDSAQHKGVVILPCCGFDSVPSDLGVLFTVRQIQEHFGVAAHRVNCVATFHGALSGGTVLSGIVQDQMGLDSESLAQHPFLLGGAPISGRVHDDMLDFPAQPTRDSFHNCWLAPFMMAPLNSRIVRRSHGLLRDEDAVGYGTDFR